MEELKTLENIFGDIKAGDLVLYQRMDKWNSDLNDFTEVDKPQMAIIVGIDIWDMACAVYYTDYKTFDAFKHEGKMPEIQGFGEWMKYWNILGHWSAMPTFTELKQSYRNAKPKIPIMD